jgi:hypothetical protein
MVRSTRANPDDAPRAGPYDRPAAAQVGVNVHRRGQRPYQLAAMFLDAVPIERGAQGLDRVAPGLMGSQSRAAGSK